jgi:acetyltransferase
MGKFVRKRKKPIVVHSLYAFRNTHPIELLRYYNIPVYDSLDVACKCIGVLAERGDYLKEYHAKVNFAINWGEKAKPTGIRIIKKALKEGRRFLLEHEAKAILKVHGAPVSRDILAKTPEEAVNASKKIGGKVALKIVSPEILHKSDVGGVKLNLEGEDEIRKAFMDIIENTRRVYPDADIIGVLVSPMARPGLEVIIGTKTDDLFGPIIMFGIGGIMVEVLRDVSFRVLPISSVSARKMMSEIRAAPILDGVRGNPPSDKKSLQKLLVICSDLMEAYPEIQEMDLNPIIVYESGASIVDARIILKEDF